ncbi:MAG: type III polyketide synthase, partial [Acidobacteriaceae bacterium]
MHILSTTAAYPQHYYTQHDVIEALLPYWGSDASIGGVFARLHKRTGVEGRYFARPLEEYAGLNTWGKTNNVWIEVAEELGERAIDCALRQAALKREQIGAIFFVSVTGVASPSIDARLVNRMRLSPKIRRNPIFGLGCVAGAAGLARAADYVRAYPDQVAVLLSVELCSLTWQRNDVSIANLIATGLFGDGAAAVLVAGDQVPRRGPRIVASDCVFFPDTEDVMGWDISENGFRIVLSPEVPRVVRENLG